MAKPHINVVFVGHVDHGKSTLVGRILYDSGKIREDEMNKLKAIAKEVGKETFEFAFVMDVTKEERKRGVTIDINWKEIETPKNHITIIDAPGHRDFIKNMITGASDADAAVLVVDVDAGLQQQTKEHLFLTRTLGIDQLVVAVNKMDKVGYAGGKFDKIKSEIERLAKLVGYQNITFVPVSAYAGDNVVKKSQKLEWFSGPTLFEALDKLKEPEKPTDKPLRMPVDKVYSIKGIGVVPIGRVETGRLKTGDTVIFEPSGAKGEVKSIEMHHRQMAEARPGDNIGFNIKGVDSKQIKRGDVMGTPANPPTVVGQNGWIEAKIVVLDHPNGIAKGHVPSMFVHTADVPVKITDIIAKIDPASGQETDKNPKLVKTGEAAIIKLQPLVPVVIEKSSLIPQLSRFALREGGMTIAAGVCTDINKG
ncbi:MAG: translation elongation factor EF-1 subunit alpha [Candidatus Aenigmarchaeota archaeon]|nr:translation elongation factor EF-1 subunit alpha [Candidatus Aenigmarchaeota archaeon]